MKVVICGAGQVGYGIAEYLSNTGADVVVIDNNASLVKRLTEDLDVQGIVGHASLPSVLQDAGLKEAEFIIAVTANDEVNIVACQIAHHMFQTPTKIARIREQAYLMPEWEQLFNKNHLAIDVTIFPEKEVAKTIERFFNYPGTFDIVPLIENDLCLMGIILKNKARFHQLSIKKIQELFPTLNFYIVMFFRQGQIFYPSPEAILQEGDEIYFIAEQSHLKQIVSALGHEETQSRKFIIAGGGRVGMRLAEALMEHKNLNFKLFEMNPRVAEQVAARLQNSEGTVLLGNILDETGLLARNLQDIETFVAVTNHDETNILSSLLAKQLGAERTICITNSMTYNQMLPPLGIDCLINPRLITISSILRVLRRGHMRSVFTLKQNAGEIIEVEVSENIKWAWKKIDSRQIDSGMHILALKRDQHIYIHNLPLEIHPHDHIVLWVERKALEYVQKLF
jgi:trk system potassium uptake protein